ncbi:hypothetical protein Tco_1087392 [Tanacetum coccineum]
MATHVSLCFIAGWLDGLSLGINEDQIAIVLSETQDLDIEVDALMQVSLDVPPLFTKDKVGLPEQMTLMLLPEVSSTDLDDQAYCLESRSIWRISELDTAYWGFLGVWTTLDIFQNIHILYLQYGVLTSFGYDVLSFIPLWSLVIWIRRIDLLSFVVFGKCMHGYAISSLMDTAYWSSE